MRLAPSVGFGIVATLGMAWGDGAHAQAFTDWASALKPGATVAVGGVAQEFAYRAGPSGVTSVDPPSTNMAAAYTQVLDAAGKPSSVTLQNANRTVSFVKAYGDTIDATNEGRFIYARASDWSRQAIAADPTVLGWKYQTFAAWQTGLGMPTGSMGAISVGAITPGTSVPQTGVFLFAGAMGGIYNDASGQDHVVSATMYLGINFTAHHANFSTTNTQDRFGAAYRDLDISGEFFSLPNHPALFGSLTTTRLAGTSSAQFYGPEAQEVGGVFTLTPKSGLGLERLAGAFGGRRDLPPKVNFTSWTETLKPGATVSIGGFAQEMTFSTDFYGTTLTFATPTALGPATFVQSVDDGGGTSGLRIFAPNGGINFWPPTPFRTYSLQDPPVLTVETFDGQARWLAADPTQLGWDYQSFGVWQTHVRGTGVFSLGVASIGAATDGAAVPTSGASTFKGVVLGSYAAPEFGIGPATADMTLTVDFVAKRAAFTSKALTYMGFGGELQPGTEINGILTYAAGHNQLTGTLTTGNGRLSGAATARFYGPAAEEVGGTFVLIPADPAASPERLIAGFGAKR